jgi:hypothetical protein
VLAYMGLIGIFPGPDMTYADVVSILFQMSLWGLACAVVPVAIGMIGAAILLRFWGISSPLAYLTGGTAIGFGWSLFVVATWLKFAPLAVCFGLPLGTTAGSVVSLSFQAYLWREPGHSPAEATAIGFSWQHLAKASLLGAATASVIAATITIVLSASISNALSFSIGFIFFQLVFLLFPFALALTLPPAWGLTLMVTFLLRKGRVLSIRRLAPMGALFGGIWLALLFPITHSFRLFGQSTGIILVAMGIVIGAVLAPIMLFYLNKRPSPAVPPPDEMPPYVHS